MSLLPPTSAAAVRVTLGSTPYILSKEQLQRYPNSLLPNLVTDPAVQRRDDVDGLSEICVTLSPADWDPKADVDSKAPEFVMELYKSGSLALACKHLPPLVDITTFQQLTAAVDFFQLPTEEVLSTAALAGALDAATGPSDLIPPLLGLHTLAAAKQAAQQVLQLQYTYRKGLGLGRSTKYVLAAGNDEQGQEALRVFAYAPQAASPIFDKLLANYPKESPSSFKPLSRDWIGVDGALLQWQHIPELPYSYANGRHGFPSSGFYTSIVELVPVFIRQESSYTVAATSNIQVQRHGYGQSFQEMCGVVLRW